MTSWHLNIWKVKIWLFREQNDISKWNKKHIFLFQKCSLFRLTKQTSNNVVGTTLNSHPHPRAFLRFKHKKEEALQTRMDNFWVAWKACYALVICMDWCSFRNNSLDIVYPFKQPRKNSKTEPVEFNAL